MKTRNGFVSNSSSSSFIICGWKGSPDVKRLEEHFNIEYQEDEDYPEDSLSDFLGKFNLNIDWYRDDDEVIWGRDYCSTYNDSIEELDLEEMQELLKEMKKLGESLNIEEPRFYSVGIR